MPVTGIGLGYGGFIGLGSVTMNPYVTRQVITYEYEGFVASGGVAGIYDAKKFNIGLAIGGIFCLIKTGIIGFTTKGPGWECYSG